MLEMPMDLLLLGAGIISCKKVPATHTIFLLQHWGLMEKIQPSAPKKGWGQCANMRWLKFGLQVVLSWSWDHTAAPHIQLGMENPLDSQGASVNQAQGSQFSHRLLKVIGFIFSHSCCCHLWCLGQGIQVFHCKILPCTQGEKNWF